MKKHHALQLYDYHVWANNKLFERLKELPEEIFNQEVQSIFPSLAATFNHIYMVDTIWLGVMRQKTMVEIQASIAKVQEHTKNKGLQEMEKLFYQLAKEYQGFLNSESDLDKEISPEHPQFGRLNTHLSELVQHVVNHGTYHRGNLSAMIRQQGFSGVPTDYVFYLYEINSTK